jgi:hypothetical protein
MVDQVDAPEAERLVVILGAGFSKAVHEALPTTDALGEKVRQRLDDVDQARFPAAPFEDGRFEEWLSYLADEQPHLTEDRTLEARALLYRVTRTLRTVLSEAQAEALGSGAPRWLSWLLSVLHQKRATVITTNYDNLVECCVEGHHRPRGSFVNYSHRMVNEERILDGLPRRADLLERQETELALEQIAQPGGRLGRMLAGSSPISTFRLLKLHGSLSWYWVPGDPTGSTLQRWLLPGLFGSPEETGTSSPRIGPPGLEPFIVPPAALKSQYLRNPVVREIWQRAYQALTSATRVAIIGYSITPADTSFSGMIADALGARDVKVEVVNVEPSPVWEHLGRLGVPETTGGRVDGKDCVARWVGAEVDKLSLNVLSILRTGEGLDGEAKLLVASRGGQAAICSVGSPDDFDGDAVLEVPSDGYPLHNSLPIRELLQYVSQANRVTVAIEDRRTPIIAMESSARSAVGVRGQVYLIPAGEW